MNRVFSFWLLTTLCASLAANSPEELRQNYRRLQTSYQEQVETLQREVVRKETDVLNRFIVSLVRQERNFQDEGDLDGMMAVRTLRESLLENAVFPEERPEYPEGLLEAIRQLNQEKEVIQAEGLTQLQEINRSFAAALEPGMRQLTRLGDFDTAREILEVRRKIFTQLGEEENRVADAYANQNLRPVLDPNVLPFSLEPASTERVQGVMPRRTQLPFVPQLVGGVRVEPKGFRFREGHLTVPEAAMDALLFQVGQIQVLSIELGYEIQQGHQTGPEGNGGVPVFYLGKTLEDANLALVHEGFEFFLMLRTSRPPADSPAHKVSLGRAARGRKVHLVVTYRSGELTAYLDGTEALKLRGQITGGLENWTRGPLVIGGAPAGGPRSTDLFWNGEIVWLHLRASHETARDVSTSYTRFADFITRPIQTP